MNKSQYPKIDKLRKRFDKNDAFDLRDTCFLLWAELGIPSANYLLFAKWAQDNKITLATKFTWVIWKSMFYAFTESDVFKNRHEYYGLTPESVLGIK